MSERFNISKDNLSEYGLRATPEYLQNKEELIKEELTNLKLAAQCGMIVKGLKETIRAIKLQKAKIVFLATDCDVKDYIKIVEDFCYLYKVKIVQMKNWLQLRDIVIDGVPSSLLIENAKRKGKILKISPKCYVAAIINYGDFSKKLLEFSKR